MRKPMRAVRRMLIVEHQQIKKMNKKIASQADKKLNL